MLIIANRFFAKRAILLQFYSFSNYFSDQTKGQKELAAKEAAQIIRFLGMDKQQLSLQCPIPLTEVIKTKLNIQSKIINNMLDPRIGIKLPNQFLTQMRITDGFHILTIPIQKRFTFFPNRMVTCRIFKEILSQTSQKLISGPVGTSKTVAFIFYTCLSQIINQYQFQFDEVINQNIPRMFYLSYKKNKYLQQMIQNEDQLSQKRKKIQAQIVEQIKFNLPKKLSEKCQNLESAGQLTSEINEHFINKRKLRIKFVFDQFNQFISEVRQYNSALQISNIPNLEFEKKKLSFDSGMWFEKASKLCNSQVFYNSSQKIQEQLFNRIPQPYFSFSIYTHTPLRKGQIKFYQLIQLPQGKREMVSILFFELKKFCLPVHLQKITQIEKRYLKNFQENLKDVSAHITFTHFQIREYLQKNKEILKLLISNSDLSNEEIEKQIKQIINDIFKQSKKKLVDEIKNFCFINRQSVSVKTEKIKFLIAVRTIIQRRLRNEISGKLSKNNKNICQITIQQIKQELGVNKKIYWISTAIIDKNIFQLQNQIDKNYNKWIRIKWSPLYFLELTNFVEEGLNKIIQQNTEMFMITFFKYLIYYNGGVGILFDHILTESIEKQPLLLKFQNNTSMYYFVIQKSLKFLHFNSNKLFVGLQQRFSEFISLSKRYKWIVGVPETRSQQKPKNSKSIDLLIFQKGVNGDYTIYTFDFTAMNSQITEKSQKITNSISFFQKVYLDYYGRIQKQKGYIFTPEQLKLKTLAQNYRKKSKELKITNIVHTIICYQREYYSQTSKVKIPHKGLYGLFTVQTSNVEKFSIQFLDMRSNLAAQNSSIFKRIINQLKKK